MVLACVFADGSRRAWYDACAFTDGFVSFSPDSPIVVAKCQIEYFCLLNFNLHHMMSLQDDVSVRSPRSQSGGTHAKPPPMRRRNLRRDIHRAVT